MRWRSSIPTNRKIQIQQCQGHDTRAIPGDIANAPQHAEVLIWKPGIQTNRKIQQCQGHGSREVLSEIANVPRPGDVTDFGDPLCRAHSVPNGKMHNRKVHSKVEDAHRDVTKTYNKQLYIFIV